MSEVTYKLLLKQLATEWQLTDAQYRCLLELEVSAIPELFKIDTLLSQLFAGSPQLATLWMTSPNRAFAGKTPMEIIEARGMAGLRQLVQFLCLEENDH